MKYLSDIFVSILLSSSPELNCLNLCIIWFKMCQLLSVFLLYFVGGKGEGSVNNSVLSQVWCNLFLVLLLYFRTIIFIFACLIFEPSFGLTVIFRLKALDLKQYSEIWIKRTIIIKLEKGIFRTKLFFFLISTLN